MNDLFYHDIDCAQEVARFLDTYFYDYYGRQTGRIYGRNTVLDMDRKGIDVVGRCSKGTDLFIDEKATTDYTEAIRPLPTFAFELGSIINGRYSEGWLTSEYKWTELYLLVWPHRPGHGEPLDMVEIMPVDRNALLARLKSDGLTKETLRKKAQTLLDPSKQKDRSPGMDKNRLEEDAGIDGIKYIRSLQKQESPVNLVINKAYLTNAADYVYWVVADNSISPRRIRSDRYYSPASWEKVAKFMGFNASHTAH